MKTITLDFGDAQIKLPERTVVENWLRGLIAQQEKSGQVCVPRIGEFWHGLGGIYAGVVRGENGAADYHLIVANGEEGQATDIEWGETGVDIGGADNEWDGAANTQALISSGHEQPAANWANQLRINGFADWYLPARRELALCYANVPELFEKRWHWSSTQYSADFAWGQVFDGGGQNVVHKDGQAQARAVRRFKLPI